MVIPVARYDRPLDVVTPVCVTDETITALLKILTYPFAEII